MNMQYNKNRLGGALLSIATVIALLVLMDFWKDRAIVMKDEDFCVLRKTRKPSRCLVTAVQAARHCLTFCRFRFLMCFVFFLILILRWLRLIFRRSQELMFTLVLSCLMTRLTSKDLEMRWRFSRRVINQLSSSIISWPNVVKLLNSIYGNNKGVEY